MPNARQLTQQSWVNPSGERVYGITPSQAKQIRADIDRALRSHRRDESIVGDASLMPCVVELLPGGFNGSPTQPCSFTYKVKALGPGGRVLIEVATPMKKRPVGVRMATPDDIGRGWMFIDVDDDIPTNPTLKLWDANEVPDFAPCEPAKGITFDTGGIASLPTSRGLCGDGNLFPTAGGGVVVPAGGPWTVSSQVIVNTSIVQGISAPLGTQVDALVICGSKVVAKEYGCYLAGSTGRLMIIGSSLHSTAPSGINGYALRGEYNQLYMQDAVLDNVPGAHFQAVFRVYNCVGGVVANSFFRGGHLILGGGASSESGNPLPFHNIHFVGLRHHYTGTGNTVDALSFKDQTHHLTFTGCDFTVGGNASSVGFMGSGTHHIHFQGCQRRYDDSPSTPFAPLTMADLRGPGINNNITVSP